RHVFCFGRGDRGERQRFVLWWWGVSSSGQPATIGTLPVAMIEPSGSAALMTLTCGAPLLSPCPCATGSTAIALPAITSATKKETRTTIPSAPKALSERLLRVGCAH